MKPPVPTPPVPFPAAYSRRLCALLAMLCIAARADAAVTAPRITVQYSEKVTITNGDFLAKGSMTIITPTIGFAIAVTLDNGIVKSLGAFDNPACIKVKEKNGALQADVSGGGDWFYP